MKTGIRTLTILTAVLAGTLVAEAQRGNGECPACGQRLNAQRPSQETGPRRMQGPTGQRQPAFQGQGQRQPAYQGQRRQGPPQAFQGQGRRQPAYQGQRRPQAPQGQRRQGPPQAFQGQRGQGQSGPAYQGQRGGQERAGNVERPRLNAEQRQKILEKHDTDGDGSLSEKERAKARKAWKKNQKANQAAEGPND